MPHRATRFGREITPLPPAPVRARGCFADDSATQDGISHRRFSCCRLRRQGGQALVFGLCLMLLLSLLLFFQFSSGQASAAKLRIVNATDAAAYSVGIWRARAMNYYAYCII